MIVTKGRQPLVIAALAGVVVFLLLLSKTAVPTASSSSVAQGKVVTHDGHVSTDAISDIQNRTLGFGAILLLSLPTRSDRQDAMSLLASETNFTITDTIPGVFSKDVDEKAYPPGPGREKMATERYFPYLGSWRSHMNLFRYIVDNNIESALVLEDDVDWDFHLRTQLSAFAVGLRQSPLRRPYTADEIANYPYGADWDMLHFAASKIHTAPAPRDKARTVYNDPFRAPTSVVKDACTDRGWFCFIELMKDAGVDEGRRAIVPTFDTVGLSAFAVSLRGAKRLLYYLSYKELVDTLDLSISDAFQKGHLRGWTVIPPIMAEWKTNGIGDSDLKIFDDKFPKGQGNSVGSSAAMHWSMRAGIKSTIEGGSYWEEEETSWKMASQGISGVAGASSPASLAAPAVAAPAAAKPVAAVPAANPGIPVAAVPAAPVVANAAAPGDGF
ncbi:hypothetical protein BZA70DRAFT_309322 [Myxozyma melibiosi]|uniref:Glycosyl transferase family 25 domain-containing protein n=1 Tax=Myxozyma melibiosi TaxID=54550 RepID=A0ABR1FBN5_9ASCO